MGQIKHLLYTPFTGLGLYGGHRGKRWLRNRIHIFKQFVVPSLQNQSEKDFTLWISWRPEDKGDPIIADFGKWLDENTELKFFFTYSGVCFWDDKYPDEIAHDRLVKAIHAASPILANNIGEADSVYVTIQPSDDCYEGDMVREVQRELRDEHVQAVGYRYGYVMDYLTKRLAEWTPHTSPPFYTIKFPRSVFLNPLEHVNYAGIKSHEYLPQKLRTKYLPRRGYLVGTHGENISTIFNHPFRGPDASPLCLKRFGLQDVEPLTLPISLRKKFMRKLPHNWQRKLRYVLGEKFAAKIYDLLRS